MRKVQISYSLATKLAAILMNPDEPGMKVLTQTYTKELLDMLDEQPAFSGNLSALAWLATKGKRPVCVLDIESTGTDCVKDRIIELAVVKVSPDKFIQERVWLIHPGFQIPAEATAVHGITDADVAKAPFFAEVADEILDFLAGCDLAGFSSNGFDVPMLSEHFASLHQVWPEHDTRQFDASTIFRKQHPRTLAAAKEQYLGLSLEGAHRALADTRATAEVLAAQLEYSPMLSALTPDELHEYCKLNPRQIDLAGKLTLNSAGEPCFNFGKEKGNPVASNLNYAYWMLRNDFPYNTKMHLERILSAVEA